MRHLAAMKLADLGRGHCSLRGAPLMDGPAKDTYLLSVQRSIAFCYGRQRPVVGQHRYDELRILEIPIQMPRCLRGFENKGRTDANRWHRCCVDIY